VNLVVREGLRRERIKRNLTYQDVADGVGITKVYYWYIENGKRGLSYELASKLALFFQKNTDEIFLSSELTNKEQKS
jgi:putative transcriptional regulator